MTKERLQKLLAQANVASRRASEDLISKGRVHVNGEVAKLGDQADPETDVITVDGARLNFENQKRIYIALNKPKQVLSTDKPHRGDNRQTVTDLIGSNEHLFSIGRLDADSDGLVVMTNDGDLAFRLTHPRYRHSKTYRVEVVGLPTAETIEAWQQGVYLEDGKTSPCVVEIVRGNVKGSVLRIIMTEGKKRQIRRVAASLGHRVMSLTRTHIGMFALSDLAPGQWREMTAKDVMALKTAAPEIKTLRGQVRGRGQRFSDQSSISDESGEDRRQSSKRTPNRPNNRRPTGTRSIRKATTESESPERSFETSSSDSRSYSGKKRISPRPSGARPTGRRSADSNSSERSSETSSSDSRSYSGKKRISPRPSGARPTGSRSADSNSSERSSETSSSDSRSYSSKKRISPRPSGARPTGRRSADTDSSGRSSETSSTDHRNRPSSSKKRISPRPSGARPTGRRSADTDSSERSSETPSTDNRNRPPSSKKRISPRPKSGTGGKPSSRSNNRSSSKSSNRSRKDSPR